jgi:hypothetical protein
MDSAEATLDATVQNLRISHHEILQTLTRKLLKTTLTGPPEARHMWAIRYSKLPYLA